MYWVPGSRSAAGWKLSSAGPIQVACPSSAGSKEKGETSSVFPTAEGAATSETKRTRTLLRRETRPEV